MIIAIDFDGTIVDHQFPEIGDLLPGAAETIRDLKSAGHTLLLWTCRENHERLIDKQYLRFALEFLEQHGIPFDGVNERLDDFRDMHCYPERRKVYADVYIDDKNLGGFPGWDKVREILLAPAA